MKCIRHLFCRVCFSFGLGKECPAHNPIKHPYAKATTPDQLIAAYFIESIAKDFSQWMYRGIVEGEKHPTYYRRESWRVLEHKEKKDLRILFKSCQYEGINSDFSIKGVPLGDEDGRKITDAYFKLKEKHDRLERLAERKRREMEEAEKKWNIAEELLGMKRLDNGALVPKDYEPENKFKPCSCSCCYERGYHETEGC